MILVDISIWVDHFRRSNTRLAMLLEVSGVVMHPYILGEIALGSLGNRRSTLSLLENLPTSVVARPSEVLDFISRHALHGRGIGYVDVHLLASSALTAETKLWTSDKRLGTAAAALRLAYEQPLSH